MTLIILLILIMGMSVLILFLIGAMITRHNIEKSHPHTINHWDNNINWVVHLITPPLDGMVKSIWKPQPPDHGTFHLGLITANKS